MPRRSRLRARPGTYKFKKKNPKSTIYNTPGIWMKGDTTSGGGVRKKGGKTLKRRSVRGLRKGGKVKGKK